MNKNPIEWAEQARQFSSEVQIEFKKVTFPTRKETVAGTISVVVVVLFVAMVLFLVDSLIAFVAGRIL